MRRVLIVDDNRDIRLLLQACLALEGFDAVTVADGAGALSLMEQAPAEVVLLDLFMPEKDGLETIIELRRRHPAAKIVAMSGWQSSAGTDYLGVATEIGAVLSLKKPRDPVALPRILRGL